MSTESKVSDDQGEQSAAAGGDEAWRSEGLPSEAVSEAARAPGLSLGQTLERVMRGYADRPALGRRATEVVRDPASGRNTLRLLPRFETVSYGELWSRAAALATAWATPSDGAADSIPALRPGDFVATIGFTSDAYLTVDLAAVYLGAPQVPLQPTAPVSQLLPILEETGPRLLATSTTCLEKAVELALTAASAPRIVVFDHHPEDDGERAVYEAAARRLGEAGRGLVTLEELIARGRSLPAVPLHVPEPGDDPLSLLIYTSGSTGAPKGAIYRESILRGYWTGAFPGIEGVPAVTVSYMPMSHMFGRVTILATLGMGGLNHFTARSDLSTLFEDIALARPTDLLAVPRIFDMLFQEYQGERDRREGEFADEEQLEAALLADLRERFLGGRVHRAVVGSAPISREMKAFAESCLGLPLHDGYGSTEAGMVIMDGRVQRPPVLEYKLVDVPELGYFHTDLPHPRGELLLRTRSIFPGYYKRPDTTASVFDAEGFYKTGDIMAETAPDQLVYLDRRNNVQKLSQGEFVAVSKVESVFTANPLIRQIYVYGSSEQPYLLAVVVPSPSALRAAGGADDLKRLLADALQRTAQDAGLESYETPRDFLVETEPFTTANGMLSDLRKLLRPRLRERYGERLEALYAELARSQSEQLRALRQGGAGRPVYETVARAAQALLGCPGTDVHPGVRFTDLGGDSLSALSFSNLLKETFGVEVPVGLVIGPAATLRSLTDHVEAQLATGADRPTFTSVHGADAVEIHAGDLSLEKFIDPAVLQAAAALPRPGGEPPRTVLLTGATGYLGRFMCVDWLERLAERGGKLVCVVRGADDAAARKRLDDTFDTGDPELLRHYRELAAGHLEVVAGDLGEARLGLDLATWDRLAGEVDAVMHPGALVNHVLPYEQLFGPNVVGTAELIRFAVTGRIKPFTNVSTIAVGDQADQDAFDEVSDIRVLSPVRKCDDSYANGYAMSKWAGEVLLREAHDACGLPVSVFRSDMILTHSRYTGQLNLPDMFTRLILSLVATGVAPASFYRLDRDGNRQRAHYDGLPADFSARAVDVIGAANTAGYRTYHVLNPHQDGLSLDTYVDWLAADGHAMTRIDDYDEWLGRFSTALRALPEAQRRQSLLPLLHSYETPGVPLDQGAAPADEFRRAVRAAGIEGYDDIPHVTPELITKYVSDLRQLGLL
ncbi:carboxylic acid reductase [Streptomyces sp. NPDC047002]|uniref:carboxylic acid reductase n=1 Tax=Streptomyces sp. NPDC047002 TaxID=3155475 RepID=UPI003452B5B8